MRIRTKLHFSGLFLLAVVAIGVTGYMYISEDTLIDSLYMTIITMTTVGFGEIHPLNDQEKIFTIILIVISIVAYAYSVTAITEYFTNGKFLQQLKSRKVQQKIQNLKGHTIVCGYGRNGKQAVSKLESFGQDCVVIEKDKELLLELEKENTLYIEGDATDDDALEKGMVHRAKSLITALPSDADNLFVVLTARQLNEELTIISRASNESSYKKLKIAGANNVIMPDKIGGEHMASLVVTPDIIEFVDYLKLAEDGSPNLEEVSINDLPEQYLDMTILDLDLRKRTGCTVIGFKTPDDQYIINPEASTILKRGSNLIVLGKATQIEKLRQVL
jgi:voltage-gated potassium channel